MDRSSDRNDPLSPAARKRLREQGFTDHGPEELAALRPGIRFAYGLCTGLVVVGALLESVPILGLTLLVTIGGTIPPNHPLDYLYNYGLRHLLGRPALPARPPQSRFACGVAGAWIAAMIYVLVAGSAALFYLLAAGLVALGTLVTLTDKYIPSLIINRIVRAS